MSRTTPSPLLRLALGAALLAGPLASFAPTLAAQVDQPQAVAGPPQQGGADPVEEMKTRLARLAKEVRFLREVRDGGGLVARMKTGLTQRTANPRSVRVKTAAAAAAAPTAVQVGARVMSEDERSEYNPQVILVVNGAEAREDEFNELVTYLRGARPEGTPEEALQREAVKELVTRKLSKAKGGKRAVEAFQKINEINKKLAEGSAFADVAKSDSECPSAPQGGDLGMFGRGAMDTTFESVAFSLKKGERSKVVETPFGYHLIYVEDKSADGKQVRARHILRMFHSDPGVTSTVVNDVARGNCLVTFRDEKFLSLSPF